MDDPATDDEAVVDLFAGPGGWDIAAHRLGLRPIGVEYDTAACRTRAANGLTTIQADVATIDPHRWGPIVGLIASPPCPQFSNAGQKRGRQLTAELCAAIDDALAGQGPDRLATHRAGMAAILFDAMAATAVADAPTWTAGIAAVDAAYTEAWAAASEAALMVEPARWIAVGDGPAWVAMEQVPAAAPVFAHYARRLQERGWSAWTGKLSAEQYGVPQTRERVILIASRTTVVQPPPPTHQRYVHGQPAGDGPDCEPTLFGPGLLPWVSMADALGWTDERQVGFPRLDDTGRSADGYRERDWRSGRVPAFCLTEKARSFTVVLGDRKAIAAVRTADEPAPTVLASADNGDKAWTHDPDAYQAGGYQAAAAVPLTAEEAQALQSFPADYVIVGTKTARFRQIGNAVPPLLAEAVLTAVTGRTRGTRSGDA